MRWLVALLFALLPVTAMAQGCGGDPQAAAYLEKATSAIRTQQGLNGLARDPRLAAAAQAHACDMARRGYFSHSGRDGSSVKGRARHAGYRACLIAENIAMGQRNAQAAFADWMKSSGHRRNILLKGVAQIGIGIAPARAGRGPYWVMVLGRPC
ncbi:CAP domain-containing protein [Thioclava atlantica]|uniref:SCP-like extracellular protein n=1 Tax=Thioclava atlantica TaxID=1317124 RepID=A0A085U0Z2_9RHOB|nr:CAP domain-containing protein [Thioclava atlantica]KFE36639.1 SCP-like extracellular protein [Thioclava atlantica]